LETNLLNKTVQVHRRSFGAYQVNSQKEVKYRQESVLESILVPVMEPLYSELQHFTNCILEKTPVKVSPKSGLRALELATEICMEIQKNSGLEIALAPGQYSEVTA
jgi:predicted dehydrogenase